VWQGSAPFKLASSQIWKKSSRLRMGEGIQAIQAIQAIQKFCSEGRGGGTEEPLNLPARLLATNPGTFVSSQNGIRDVRALCLDSDDTGVRALRCSVLGVAAVRRR